MDAGKDEEDVPGFGLETKNLRGDLDLLGVVRYYPLQLVCSLRSRSS